MYSDLNNYTFFLASKSPRRRQLLSELGIDFTVIDIHHDEILPDSIHINDVAEYLAVEKSKALDNLKKNEVLITADTIVVLDGKIMHKPANVPEAVDMIRKLSGREHRVDTGVCLRSEQASSSFTASTVVKFRNLEDAEIRYYVEHFKPFDKAGGYGIQEWIGYIGVEYINGCYYNVMGLPLSRLYAELKQFLKV